MSPEVRKMKTQHQASYEELLKTIKEKMSKIKHKVMIISGKGGVGKSSVTVLLALSTALKNRKVGILDADIHGPSIPKIMGLNKNQLLVSPLGILPVEGPYGVKVVSTQFILPNEDVPVIWRGPLKGRLIAEFLANVQWGTLDYLYIDLPPGTGDEPLSVAQYIRNVDGAIIVTIPSDLSRIVVKKAINFCRKLNIKVIGIIENMSGFTCPKCGTVYHVFGSGAGRKIAVEMNIPFLGEIPLDPRLSECNDKGEAYIIKYKDTQTTKAIMKIAENVIERIENQ